ncbi:carboxypeptidase regulatory-like domain-containing protein [Kitasatospora gansuensis]
MLADGAIDRTAVTAADGSYSLANLAEGSYTVTVTKYGYQPATSAVTVVADQTVSQDFAVEQAPSATVTGTVRSGGTPAAGSVVTVAGTPVSATTDAVGQYRFTLPLGEYDVTASSPYRCADQALRHLSLTGDTTADIELPVRTDTFGYSCAAGTGEWVGGSTKLALTGDTAAEQVRLPFAVPLYGGVHTVGYVSTDGVLSFPAASTVYSNGAIPSPVCRTARSTRSGTTSTWTPTPVSTPPPLAPPRTGPSWSSGATSRSTPTAPSGSPSR